MFSPQYEQHLNVSLLNRENKTTNCCQVLCAQNRNTEPQTMHFYMCPHIVSLFQKQLRELEDLAAVLSYCITSAAIRVSKQLILKELLFYRFTVENKEKHPHTDLCNVLSSRQDYRASKYISVFLFFTSEGAGGRGVNAHTSL